MTADAAPLPTNLACGAEEPLPALAPSAATAPVPPEAADSAPAAAAGTPGDGELPVKGTSAARLTTTAEPGEDNGESFGVAAAATTTSGAAPAEDRPQSGEDVEMGEAGAANGSA